MDPTIPYIVKKTWSWFYSENVRHWALEKLLQVQNENNGLHGFFWRDQLCINLHEDITQSRIIGG